MGYAGASSTTGLAARSGLGDRGAGESARSGLGDRGAGESACWSSKLRSNGRRRTARGGGIGGCTGGGRGGNGNDVADTDCSLTLNRCRLQWRHREVALPPQLSRLCADEIVQADVVLRRESRLVFASP